MTLLSSQDLGGALRAKRQAAGLTQAVLAQRAGCRRQTIVALEAGKNVEIKTLMAALAVLGKVLLIVDVPDQGGRVISARCFNDRVRAVHGDSSSE